MSVDEIKPNEPQTNELNEDKSDKMDVDPKPNEANNTSKLEQEHEPILSNAKLPQYFQKPKSKYKKQIYINALTVYVNIHFFPMRGQVFRSKLIRNRTKILLSFFSQR